MITSSFQLNVRSSHNIHKYCSSQLYLAIEYRYIRCFHTPSKYHTFKMADPQPHQRTEKGGKSKPRWRNPSNFHKIGNKEKGGPLVSKRCGVVDMRHEFFVNRIFLLYNRLGHAFVEKRKRQALKQYRKLLRKTRNEHFSNQAADNGENILDKPALVTERAPPVQVCLVVGLNMRKSGPSCSNDG